MNRVCGVLLLILLVVLLSGCTSPGGPGDRNGVPGTGSPQGTITVYSPAIPENGSIPAMYGCRGAGTPILVSWDNEPAGTRSVVLILEDPDAPGGVFTHWLVYNIPPGIRNAGGDSISGARTGLNSAGGAAYFPPCPPAGETHHYLFRVYALDTMIDPPHSDRDSVTRSMSGHVLATGSAGGIFSQ